MCTVTIVPFHDGSDPALRIACNRDEARQRPPALLPQLRLFGQRWAILPVDPASGGTWIAINDAGLAMVLLNQNSAPGSSSLAAWLSRGTIIPSLLHCDSLHSAKRLAYRLADESFAPFRLILADRTETIEVSAVEKHLQIVERPRLDAPLMFTSSGLGDALVEGPRRKLFHERFHTADDWVEKQDGFHRHSWPNRQHLSVCMRREDACTVSYTVMDVRPRSAVMTYFPQAPDEAGPCVSLDMGLRPAEAA
ncbi:MAG: NRDE family protein [Gemmataceae bacterium]|nr:NRDE family protein [Gemmataceae bacterium]